MDKLLLKLVQIRSMSDNVPMESSHSRHIAAIFIEKNGSCINLLSVGQNHPDYSSHQRIGVDGLSLSIHAEDVAITKLPYNYSGKNIRVSMLVIRISRSSSIHNYKMSNSKPCFHCTSKMLRRRGYTFNKIYFSTDEGTIDCLKIRDLNPIISKFYRKRLLDERT